MTAAFRTVDDVAKSLVISPRTVTRMCLAGILPAYRVGRQWRIDQRRNRETVRRQWRNDFLHSSREGMARPDGKHGL